MRLLPEHFRANRYRNFPAFFLFELVFKLGALLFLYSLGRFAFRTSMRAMHYSYLTSKNMVSFLTRPVNLVIAALLVILFLIMTLIEFSALFYGYDYSVHLRRITAAQMLLLGANRAGQLLMTRPIRTLLLMIPFVPYAYLPVGVLILYRLHLLSTFLNYISYTNPALGIAVGIGVVAVLILGVYFLFLIPAILLRDLKGKEALRDSYLTIRKHFPGVIGRILLANGLYIGVLAVLYLAALHIAVLLLSSLGSHTLIYARMTVASNWMIFVLVILAGFFGFLGNSMLIYDLYHRFAYSNEQLAVLLEDFSHPAYFFSPRANVIASLILVAALSAECIAVFREGYNSSLISLSPFDAVQITAHRGASMRAPENTIASIEAAIEEAADYAEIDVQLTSDDVVVLMHDITLNRTASYNEYVYNMTYAQMRELDAGSHKGEEFAGEHIPTLVEVLETCKGKLNLNIELKADSHYLEKLAPQVVSLIQYFEMENQCVITSMDYRFLRQVKELDPEIRTGYIVDRAFGGFTEMNYADFLSMRFTGISERLVRNAHMSGKEVWCWTVNTPVTVRNMAGVGVDNIITDNPAMTRTALADEHSTYSELLFNMLIND